VANAPAALRDELAEATRGTAIIDEADEANSTEECEKLYAARCSPTTGNLTFKKLLGPNIPHQQVSVGVYGATILHYRIAFADQATGSRSITISTRYREGQYEKDPRAAELTPMLQGLGKVSDLSDVAGFGGGRVHDVWAPLLAVAQLVKDSDWLEWAREQMEKEIEDL